jgi:hypothetical protein
MPADLAVKKMPFLVQAVYACIRHPLLDIIDGYLDEMSKKIHRELGDNGVYLGLCMAPPEEGKYSMAAKRAG